MPPAGSTERTWYIGGPPFAPLSRQWHHLGARCEAHAAAPYQPGAAAEAAASVVTPSRRPE